MGVVMSATASLDWVARMTGSPVAELDAQATAWIAAEGPRAAPVFLPCLTGIRTPLNRPDMQGCMSGLHPGVTPAMLAYATMEGVAFQFADCVAAQHEVGTLSERITAVGGGTRSQIWLRLLATVLDRPVSMIGGADTAGPLGAARLAAVASGSPMSVLHEPVAVTRVILPDQDLAAAIAPRRTAMTALTMGQGTVVPS
jgi:xylulokinase